GRTLEFTRFDSSLLDFVGLKYVLLPPALKMPARFRKIGDYGSVALYENSAALPRARLASKIRAGKTEEGAEGAGRGPQLDPKGETVIQTDKDLPVVYEGEVSWKKRTTDSSELEVTTKAPAVLVVADTDYAGWEATVDGKSASILRANSAFRAVEVPAGTHKVEFRFRPFFYQAGLPASLLFLLLAPAAAWRG